MQGWLPARSSSSNNNSNNNSSNSVYRNTFKRSPCSNFFLFIFFSLFFFSSIFLYRHHFIATMENMAPLLNRCGCSGAIGMQMSKSILPEIRAELTDMIAASYPSIAGASHAGSRHPQEIGRNNNQVDNSVDFYDRRRLIHFIVIDIDVVIDSGGTIDYELARR